MRKLLLLLCAVSAVMAFSGCKGSDKNDALFALLNHHKTPASETLNFIATGGTGSSGTGGTGGQLIIGSTGKIKILKSGTVDASFAVSKPTPSFGPVHAVVTAATGSVLADADGTAGNLCMVTTDTDGALYIGDGDGTCGTGDDQKVTGVTVNAGVTLRVPENGSADPDFEGYGWFVVENDVVINGTVSTPARSGLEIDATNIIINKTGKLDATPTEQDTDASTIWLGWMGATTGIYNHGKILANGTGTGGSGSIWLEADDFVVNDGLIEANGGSSDALQGGDSYGGGDNTLEVYVDYGNFYSSGTVRLNGGTGETGGGTGGSAYIETVSQDNNHGMNGDIVLSGTWEANGGEGKSGAGGNGGYMLFQTDAMGKIAVNATIRIKGGKGSGEGATGGSSEGIDFYSYNDQRPDSVEVEAPGKIQVAGKVDLSGGDGDQDGGNGGYLTLNGIGANSAFAGVDVEVVGFPVISLNGGAGADGGAASDLAVGLFTLAPQYPNFDSDPPTNVSVPAGSITNQAKITAIGGKAGAAGTGGTGGNVAIVTNVGFSDVADATTVITNSGTIDISGGTGDTGGDTYGYFISGGGFGEDSIYVEAQHVTNTGSIIANGGKGNTKGGGGGDIDLWSNDDSTPTTNSGFLSAAGGAPGGNDGNIYIDGNPI